VKNVTRPDIEAIGETVFADQIYVSQDGVCIDLFENLRVNRLKRELSNDTVLSNNLFSHWSMPNVGVDSSHVEGGRIQELPNMLV
jgi:hypothetical protein